MLYYIGLHYPLTHVIANKLMLITCVLFIIVLFFYKYNNAVLLLLFFLFLDLKILKLNLYSML